MEVRFDAEVFRNAARAITLLKTPGSFDFDLTPVQNASKYLEGYGKTLEEFRSWGPATHTLLRAGAQRISRRCIDDSQLFSVIREMIGTTRDIKNANGKLDRTHMFLAELGRICP